MESDFTEGLVSVLEDIAETAAVYGDEQQRTVARVKYAKKFVDDLLAAQRQALRDEVEKAVDEVSPDVRPISEDAWTRGVEGTKSAINTAISTIFEGEK